MSSRAFAKRRGSPDLTRPSVTFESGPLCAVCGAYIGVEYLAYAQYVTNKRPLRGMRNPLSWSGLYRVIIVHKDKHLTPSERPHKLSGIAEMDGEFHKKFIVPQDKDRVFKGRAWRWRKTYDILPYGIERIPEALLFHEEPDNVDKYGHPIHANCWTLTERIIGRCAEKYLGLFCQVLVNRWADEDETFGLGEELFEEFDFNDEDWAGDGLTSDKFCLRDPLYIPAVRTLIRRARRPYRRLKISKKRRDILNSLRLGLLPVDVQCLILDYLDYNDAKNVLRAAGWQVGDEYWRARFPRDIIFEITEVDPTFVMNWQFLCLEAEALMENNQSLLNRRRIMRLLREDRESFFSDLRSRDIDISTES